jgi:hypothetical protein
MRGGRWCDLIGPWIFGAVRGSLGVPTQSLSDAVPGDRPNTSVAAIQIAPSCTAHPVSFSRLGQFIYAVVHPSPAMYCSWSLTLSFGEISWFDNVLVYREIQRCDWLLKEPIAWTFLLGTYKKRIFRPITALYFPPVLV